MQYQTFLIQISQIADRLGMRRLNRHLKILLFKSLGFIFRRRKATPLALNSIQKILIVKQHNQMGDMLCSTPLFRALRLRFPRAHLTLIAGQENETVVKEHPDLNEVIVFHKLNFLADPRGFWRFLRQIRAPKYDLGIVPATVSMSVTSDLICWLSGARYRLGVHKLDGETSPAGFLFNLPVSVDWRATHKHQIERNLDLLRAIGIESTALAPSIGISNAAREIAEKFLNDHVQPDARIIGFHPGAGKIPNRWEAQRFAQLADILARRHQVKIFITSGPSDATVVAEMTGALKQPAVICQGFTIQQVAALMQRMILYITNDTGTMHLAAAVGVPTLSLFGPTDPYQWAPRGEMHRFLAGQQGSIQTIQLDDVLETAEQMLQRPRRSQ
ncbi:glycosyltransferase family 9 protein [candidate division KSB1 bacterium]|nr:glycosyltransferase family 9 protein [candidate division KSB1 bacterium]